MTVSKSAKHIVDLHTKNSGPGDGPTVIKPNRSGQFMYRSIGLYMPSPLGMPMLGFWMMQTSSVEKVVEQSKIKRQHQFPRPNQSNKLDRNKSI